jgi:hypothetical protein
MLAADASIKSRHSVNSTSVHTRKSLCANIADVFWLMQTSSLETVARLNLSWRRNQAAQRQNNSSLNYYSEALPILWRGFFLAGNQTNFRKNIIL